MPFQKKHGFSGTKFYNQWRYLFWNKSKKNVNPKWKDFNIFLQEMHKDYFNIENIYPENSKISLKMLDKNKKYCKENCYWGINESINKIKLDEVVLVQDKN